MEEKEINETAPMTGVENVAEVAEAIEANAIAEEAEVTEAVETVGLSEGEETAETAETAQPAEAVEAAESAEAAAAAVPTETVKTTEPTVITAEEVQQMIAEAEQRGYLRGKNEQIEQMMSRGGMYSRIGGNQSVEPAESEVMILNNMRRSVWG